MDPQRSSFLLLVISLGCISILHLQRI